MLPAVDLTHDRLGSGSRPHEIAIECFAESNSFKPTRALRSENAKRKHASEHGDALDDDSKSYLSGSTSMTSTPALASLIPSVIFTRTPSKRRSRNEI